MQGNASTVIEGYDELPDVETKWVAHGEKESITWKGCPASGPQSYVNRKKPFVNFFFSRTYMNAEHHTNSLKAKTAMGQMEVYEPYK